MLLTITTNHSPATDLGYLLGKHPDRFQTFELSFGKAQVFYPEATAAWEHPTFYSIERGKSSVLVQGLSNLSDGATGRLKTRQGCDSRQIAGKKIG